jgi:hypothetical protein
MSSGHQSYAGPFTKSGRPAMVPRPPWHNGWLITVSIEFDQQGGGRSIRRPGQDMGGTSE